MENSKQRHGTQAPQASTHAVELDDAQLEQARGGASDYLLVLDGIKGESGDRIERGAAITARSIQQK